MTTEHDSDNTAEVIKNLAIASTRSERLMPGDIHAWLSPDGQLHQVDLTDDRYLDFPKRKAGTVTVANVASFAHYYAKHASDDSEVFADLDHGTFTAVLDAHGGDTEDARWQQHRLVLQLVHTLPWKTWTGRDRQMQTQQDFAEFLEDNARDVTGNRATAADLLEVAQHFQAHSKVNFTQAQRLATGATQLVYTEEVDAKAGERGQVVIPTEFDLGILPYEDAEPKVVAARFRYRLNSGKLTLGYFLNDPDRHAREAAGAIGGKLAQACGGITVMHGTPAR